MLVAFLFLIGVGSIVFGIVRLQGSIHNPFKVKESVELSGSLLDGVDRGGVDVEGLKAQDTDGDGLNDYQETYIIQTSAYLPDTDGDGIGDKEELARGSSPTCPEGKTCFGTTVSVRAPINPATPSAHTDGMNPAGAVLPQAQSAQAISQVLTQFQSKTPQEIRDFLSEQGIPAEQLKQIPDALLQDIYNQGLTKAITNIKAKGVGGESSGQQSSPIGSAPTDPSRLSAAEIRSLLQLSGKVPLDILNNVPDSALKDIFMKAVNTTKQ